MSNLPSKEILLDRARKNLQDLERDCPLEFQRFVDSAILDIPALYEEIFDDIDLFDVLGLEDSACELFLIIVHIDFRRRFYEHSQNRLQ